RPTIDGAGQMVLVSRPDKGKPESEFKQIYRAAKAGTVSWVPMFLPWYVDPNRDAAWYETHRKDCLHATGSLDSLYEQYPATDAEALAPRSLDKRINPEWLLQCYLEKAPAPRPYGNPDHSPPIPGLVVYKPPEPGHRYVIGADPAQGNPTSDDSALEVLDLATG